MVDYLNVGFFALFPFMLFFVLETVNIPNGAGNRLKLRAAWLSGLALFLAYLIIFSVTGSLFLSGLLTAGIFGFAYLFAFYRYTLTGWVFVPADLTMLKQLREMAGFVRLRFYPVLINFFVFMALLLLALYNVAKNIEFTVNMRLRLVLVAFALVNLIILILNGKKVINFLRINPTEPANKIYTETGFMLGFFVCLFNNQPALEGYDKKTVLETVQKIKITEPKRTDAENPDVIVVMSEAFADLNIFDGVTFSRDPMPFFRSLEGAAKGLVSVPVIGGRTCNTEFEFLTGNSMRHIGMDIMAFEYERRFVPKDDGRALPQLFRKNGYTTVSLHPFKGKFYNRAAVHPKLGFDRCVFIDDMVNPKIKGDYVSDESFTDEMLRQIEAAGDKPLFLYGISMQNHYYYYPKKYPDYDVTASGNLDRETLGCLNAYNQGVFDADIQLRRLVEYLKNSKRKTVLLFFGDHKPLMGKTAFGAYVKAGLVESENYTLWTDEQNKLMFSAPYILWCNYEAQTEDWGDVPAYSLGSLAARSAGLRLNLYNEFLINFNEKGFSERLKLIQYDKIYGQGYADKILSGSGRNPLK
jgi:phosphoglycerol transferase MdoB-like AlkP superfamily enzyme